ncbi:MAG: cyanophycin synthetase [Planctomycetota bacterium]|jgi:cyanophycin synthetase
MNILEHRALRGPNRHSRYPAILMLLDLGELEERSSEKIIGFTDRLVARLPSLQSHRCSVGEPGGFIQRMNRGTWAGHIVEHVALELQCLAGMEVGYGKTLDTSTTGIYKVVYRYRDEAAGLLAGREAVALVEATIEGNAFDVEAVVAQLQELREAGMLGPSTASIVEEAERRGIPMLRLNAESFVQLGYGGKQRRVQATMTNRTSALGVEIADEKFRTKTLLAQAGIPVAAGLLVESIIAARLAAEEIGFPVAVKPEVGNHGRGITARVSDPIELEQAFVFAQRRCPQVIIEKSLDGFDFRVLVIDGVLVAAALREPAHVVGDGTSSIHQLVDEVNSDPRRGFGHERVLTAIEINDMTDRVLALQGYDLNTILEVGQKLYLKSTANLSSGGTARDVTDEVHQDVRLMCERAARLIGLDCIGIDIVAPGLDAPLPMGSSGIVEVNAAPGFRMHLAPTQGRPRNVAQPFVEMLFPVDANFEVPIVAVTGTNGKTTTAKLIAHALKYGGAAVGFAGTTGVEIDGVNVISGDYSGPEGAGIVLREPTIDHAVLEVARGGIVRRGLGFANCDVGILLNVESDHIGMDGVEDLEELALVKSVVIEVVRKTGVCILNADDTTVVGLVDRAGGDVIYFSLRDDNPVVAQHLKEGGVAVVLNEGEVLIQSKEPTLRVIPIIEAPITMRGLATFNTANVLAAVAALYGLGVPVDLIRNGMRTFHPSVTQNPGRMNVIDFLNFKVIIDYAHNVPAVEALGRSLPLLTAGRKIVVAHGTGSRPEAGIREFGAALASVYDFIVVTELDPRDRRIGETTELIFTGAIDAKFPTDQIEIVMDPLVAVDRAFAVVQPGDLIVIQVDQVEPMLNRVMAHFERLIGYGAAQSEVRGTEPVLN